MGLMHVCDKKTGDFKVMWDKTKPEEVEAAREQFDALIAKGYQAFRATGEKGDKGGLLRAFDPAVERIILAPGLQGG